MRGGLILDENFASQDLGEAAETLLSGVAGRFQRLRMLLELFSEAG
jgi:hypothetical protein